MATTASAVRTKSINLGVVINTTLVYATPTGLKLGPRGKVVPPGQLLAGLDKGTARKVRKACYRAGLHRFAAMPTPPHPVATT